MPSISPLKKTLKTWSFWSKRQVVTPNGSGDMLFFCIYFLYIFPKGLGGAWDKNNTKLGFLTNFCSDLD